MITPDLSESFRSPRVVKRESRGLKPGFAADGLAVAGSALTAGFSGSSGFVGFSPGFAGF